ncbi:hypothetical protein OH77DRAFT_637575 [Trametes cingulata]|nr:hypothetical protein OH77DRAFT_637575 [Trametes cingulata]
MLAVLLERLFFCHVVALVPIRLVIALDASCSVCTEVQPCSLLLVRSLASASVCPASVPPCIRATAIIHTSRLAHLVHVSAPLDNTTHTSAPAPAPAHAHAPHTHAHTVASALTFGRTSILVYLCICSQAFSRPCVHARLHCIISAYSAIDILFASPLMLMYCPPAHVLYACSHGC